MKGRSIKSEPIPLGKLELLTQVEHLLCSVKEGYKSDERRADALKEIALSLNILFNQAPQGDKLGGWFLLILLAFLSKRKDQLQRANKEFRSFYAKLESKRLATKRSRGLRERIEEVLSIGNLHRQALGMSRRLMRDRRIDLQDDLTVILPTPDYRSEDAIAKWSAYVYRELRKVKHELAEQCGIGDLKRYQVDGKFQVSQVKDDIPKIVRRIFRTW